MLWYFSLDLRHSLQIFRTNGASSPLAGACNLEVRGLNPGRFGYLSSWLCIYSAPVQRYGVYSAASGFLLSRYCHDCAESDVKQ